MRTKIIRLVTFSVLILPIIINCKLYAQEDTTKGIDYFNMGVAAYGNSNYLEAVEYFEKAILLAGKAETTEDSVNCFLYSNLYLGGIFSFAGEIEKAEKCYNEALKYYVEKGDLSGQGDIYLNLGDNSYYKGDITKAEALYKKGLECFEQINNSLGLGRGYFSLGDISRTKGKNEEAGSLYQKALKYYEEAGTFGGQGNVYFRLGEYLFITGDNPGADSLFNIALGFYEMEGEPVGQGNVNKSLGDLALQKGNSQSAEIYYQKALKFFEQAGQAIGQGIVYFRLGELAKIIGDNVKAEDLYNTALQFFEKAGDPIGLGNVYASLGDITSEITESEKAEEFYYKALTYYELSGNNIGVGNANFKLGNIAEYKGDKLTAKEKYEKALISFEKAGQAIGQGNICQSLAQIAFLNGENEDAEKLYIKALNFFEKAASQNNIALLSFSLSNFYMSRDGKGDAALEYLKKGMNLLDQFRSTMVREDDRMKFIEKYSNLISVAVNIALKLNEPTLAYKYFETGKSRTLTDILSEKKLNLDSELDPEILKKKKSLEYQISKVQTELNTSLPENIDSLKAELKTLQEEFDKFIFEIRSTNPAFASIEYPMASGLKEIQSILKENEVILEYFFSGANPYLFFVTAKDFEIIPIESTSGEINENTAKLIERLADNDFDPNLPPLDRDSLNSEAMNISIKLYDLLINPVESKINNKSELIIIPDGGLNVLPMEILYSGKNFLLENFSIKYYQSATLLNLMRTTLKKEHKSKGFGGFGDPVYDLENYEKGEEERGIKIAQRGESIYSDYLEGNFDRAGLSLTRLPGTGEEIGTIDDLFKQNGMPSKIFLRKDATEVNAKMTELQDYRYISFACHGLIQPGFQSLVLTQSKEQSSSGQDGFFTFEEIISLNWDAELVVLSACQTGKGEMKKTEGVVGLTRAVMYAGSDAVVVSLWNVSDEGTKDLMIQFFDNILNKKMTKSEALRDAKLKFIKNKRTPFIWSPFVMYGE